MLPSKGLCFQYETGEKAKSKWMWSDTKRGCLPEILYLINKSLNKIIIKGRFCVEMDEGQLCSKSSTLICGCPLLYYLFNLYITLGLFYIQYIGWNCAFFYMWINLPFLMKFKCMVEIFSCRFVIEMNLARWLVLC